MIDHDFVLPPGASNISSDCKERSDAAMPYRTLVTQWRELSRSQGFALQEFVIGIPARRVLCARIGAHRRRQIMISAGVHGDEPVTPWALLDIVRRGLLDSRYGYMLWCCVNPTGYEDGMRENVDRVDINRTFCVPETKSVEAKLISSICSKMTFSLALDLHEDTEAEGFYCYEATRDASVRRIGNTILKRICRSGYTLQEFTPEFDLGYSPSYLRTACRLNPGIVSLPHESYGDDFAGGTMLTTHLLRAGLTHRTITLETPRRQAWIKRIAMHTIAIVGAIQQIHA